MNPEVEEFDDTELFPPNGANQTPNYSAKSPIFDLSNDIDVNYYMADAGGEMDPDTELIPDVVASWPLHRSSKFEKLVSL